jgi:hypothetical protein
MQLSVAIFHQSGTLLALTLLLLSGISLSLGQSTVLLANGVRPVRFVLAILTEGFIFTMGVMIWALSIYTILNLLFDIPATLTTITLLLAISYTPYLLGFLVFLPYFGVIWHMILRAWVFFLLLVLVGSTFDLSFWTALFTCALGGVVLELLARLPIFQVSVWQERILRAITGKDELLTAVELADRLAAEIRPGASSS